jgi:drug/metabolite transporter (DMT)-like permease
VTVPFLLITYGALALAPVALFALPPAMPAAKATASLLVLGAGGTGIAFLVFYTLIAEIGPGRASLVAYIAPGFAVLYGVWLLGERLTAGALLGLVLILAGSWIAAEGRLPGQALISPAAPLEPPTAREAA